MKDRPPFFLGDQVNEILRIAEASCVGSVIGPAGLRYYGLDFWKRRKDDACLIREPLAFCQARTVGQRAACPDGALVEMRQELRADDSTERKKYAHCNGRNTCADSDPSIFYGPLKTIPVAVLQKLHNRVAPFPNPIPEEQGSKHRYNENGKCHSAEKR